MFEEIRALADAATPGPWEPGTWYGTDDGGWAAIGPHHVGSEDEHLPHGCEPDCDHHEQAKADARFIAAAREAVPALLAELQRAEGLYVHERDQLIAHRDALLAELAKAEQHIGRWVEVERANLLAELERLRAWLGEHGEHYGACDVLRFDDDGRHLPCSCGFNSVAGYE